MRTIIKLINDLTSNSAYFIGIKENEISLYMTSLNYFHRNVFLPEKTLYLWDDVFEKTFLFYPDLDEEFLKFREWWEYPFSYESLPE